MELSTFSFWTFLALPFLIFHSSQVSTNTSASKNTFAITVDPSVKIDELQARYFMTGDFGGLGGFRVEQAGEHRIAIHTEEGGMAAKSLKIDLYAPHCQIQTISIEDLSLSTPESEFHCSPVGDTKLQGRFTRGQTTPDRKMEVQIRYLGFWGHKFFGITDGAVLTFDIAKSSVEQDGSFQADLPNFAESDRLSPQLEDASFWVIVRDADSGNFLAELKPRTSLSRDGNLKIIRSYQQSIEFVADWHAASSAK